MQVKSFGTNTLIAQIDKAVRDAHDRGEIIFGVDITKDEYAQLKTEFASAGSNSAEITHVAPSGVPVYVEGKHMGEELVQRLMFAATPAPADKRSLN